eukprot:sb/3467754/
MSVNLDDLVIRYRTVESHLSTLTSPFISTTSYLLSWRNIPLSSLALTVILALLHRPYIIHVLSAGLVGLLFSLGYLDKTYPTKEEKKVDPVSFLNPQYYSLQQTGKRNVVREFKGVLVDLDTTLITMLRLYDTLVDIVRWRDVHKTRGVLGFIMISLLLPLNTNQTLSIMVIFLFLYNRSFFSLVRSILNPKKGKKNKNQSPEHYFSDEYHDSQETESEEGEVPACGHFSGGPFLRCGYCGCLYCGGCCGNNVTKATLGVTNPDTMDTIVRVCDECVSNLPSPES